VATRAVGELDEGALVQLMIGRRLEQYFPAPAAGAGGEGRVRVAGLSSPGRFRDVSFALHAGEVVGLAGLVGAGRSEIAQALFGLDRAATGTITGRGRPATSRSAADSTSLRLGVL